MELAVDETSPLDVDADADLLGPLNGPAGRRMKDLSGLEVTVPVLGQIGGGTACRAQVEHDREEDTREGAKRRMAVNIVWALVYLEGVD